MSSVERIDEEWIRSVPKAEVHVHLEGGFSLRDLVSMAKEDGERLPGPAASLFDLTTHYDYRPPQVSTGGGEAVGAGGLSGFLQFLNWECTLVRTRRQAELAAYAFAARESASGVRYCDAIVNPTHWGSWRGRELDLIDALSAGLDEAQEDGFCTVNLAYSLLRSQSPNEAEAIVRGLLERRPRRVVALSVDGDELVSGRTGQRFHTAFTMAAQGGLHRTVHAGESSGPEGVWDALDLLSAERIDHGVRAIEDPRLLETLKERNVSLGVCPRSNVTLGLFPSWSKHPLPELVEQGVTVTINTDDPAPLGASLEQDWAVCASVFGFTKTDLVGFAENSITASFADKQTKARLLAELSEIRNSL